MLMIRKKIPHLSVAEMSVSHNLDLMLRHITYFCVLKVICLPIDPTLSQFELGIQKLRILFWSWGKGQWQSA